MAVKRNLRADERVFVVKAMQRDYRYRVYVTKRSGKVRCIVAGCRYWPTFAVAFAHYRGERPGCSQWSNEAIKALMTSSFDSAKGWHTIEYRGEARAILRTLENKVRKYQRRCENARARARRR